MKEYFFQCPYCWENISMLIDVSQKSQKYIEDCEVCCNLIQLQISVSDGEITTFSAESIEQ